MKVKDLIEKLKKLDQEKQILLIYDRYKCDEPIVYVYHESESLHFPSDCPLKEGDYLFDAY